LAAIAGVVAMPGFTAPKLLWLRGHEKEIFRRIRTVLLAKDYVRLRLTGEYATDMADGAGTLMLDEAAREWSAPILDATGIDGEIMPRLLEGTAWSGMVRPPILAAWGIDHQVVVAGGAGDVAAGAIGIGAINDGDQFVSLGTAAQIFVARDRYHPSAGTLVHAFAHALPGRWFEMAAILNGGACLDWLSRIVGDGDVGQLIAAAEAAFHGPSPVTFLPYLSGERTPLNDPEARGAFANLDLATGTGDLVQAVLDGVAVAIKDAALAFGAAADAGPIAIIGGGARSSLWTKLVASALDRPLLRLAGTSGPAYGAARLGRLAATGEPVATVCVEPPIVDVVDPEPALVKAYEERLERARSLYAALRRTRSPRPATGDRRPPARP
jgi:xylulokinase